MVNNADLLHSVLHSAKLLEEELRKRMDALGIRHKQARVIDALARMEPASQVALAREFDVSPASMSTMTVRLIEAGFISREADPNEARSNILRLTEKGRALLVDIEKVWGDTGALVVEQLGADDALTYARLSLKLRDSLGGHVPGAPDKRPASDICLTTHL